MHYLLEGIIYVKGKLLDFILLTSEYEMSWNQ